MSESAPNRAAASRRVIRVEAGDSTQRDDRLAIEEPLEIRIGNQPLAITMRTPGHDAELAAGFFV